MTSPFDPAPPESPLDAPPDRSPLGEWASQPDYRMRASSVEECEVEPYFAPRPGHEKVGVLVELEGTTTREVPVNALYASLTDAEGHSYEPTAAGCRPALPAGRITEGQRSRGFISFELPKQATGLVLHYRPSIIGQPARSLSFDLGR